MSGGKKEKNRELYLDRHSREGLSQKVTLNKNLKDTKESSVLGPGCL